MLYELGYESCVSVKVESKPRENAANCKLSTYT
jgi:hypothetical protein